MQGESSQIIDVHVHVGDFNKLREDIQALLLKKELNRDFCVRSMLSDPKKLSDYLADADVVAAVLLAEDGPGTNFHITTEYVCSFANHGNAYGKVKMIPFGSINPHRTTDLIDAVDTATALGAQGFKLYPDEHGFNPLTDDFMEVYSEMENRDLILMFHTGASAQVDADNAFANPKAFEPLLKGFPDLSVIFAHAGKPRFGAEAGEMARAYERCFLDTSFITAGMLRREYPDISQLSSKLLFGSDWPAGVSSLKQHLSEYNATFGEQFCQSVCHDNAASLLGLVK